jgi:hypothetical protein
MSQLHLGHPVGKFQKLILEQGQEADLQLDQTVAKSHIHKQVIAVFPTREPGLRGLPLQVPHQDLEQMLLMQIVIQVQFLKQPVEVTVRQIGRMYLLVEITARLKVQPVYTLSLMQLLVFGFAQHTQKHAVFPALLAEISKTQKLSML